MRKSHALCSAEPLSQPCGLPFAQSTGLCDPFRGALEPSAGRFAPSGGSRSAFLWRAAGEPEPKGSAAQFTDVIPGSYYEKAVAWAIGQGITKGTTEETFSPNDTVTRAQVVTFLHRAAGEPEAKEGAPAFADVAQSAYYCGAVRWAAGEGITAGVDATHFAPAAPCTRAQIVTFLYRAEK